MVKRRNFIDLGLTPYMKDIPLGPGETFHLVADKTTDPYFQLLKNRHVDDEHIVTTLAAAYALMTTAQGDNLLVYPGTYTTTAELDWDKDYTLVYGMGGPQQSGFDQGTIITTTTATVGATIHNTGDKTRWYNVTISNQGAAATALTAFNNAGPGTRMVGCQIVGMLGATACDTALASSLQMSANGYYFYAEDCVIGTTDAQIQGSDTNAPLYYVAGAMVSDNMFRRCLFQTQIAAATRPIIYVGQTGCDRQQIFEDCTFYAFATNHAVACNQVISDANTSTHDILFKYCAALNCTAFKTSASAHVWAVGGRELDHIQGVAYPCAAS